MEQITLEQAIADVRSYIDDPRGRRWSAAQVRRAIHGALSECMEEYAGKGGDRFDDEIDVETSASTGAVSLYEHDPIALRAVLVSNSSGGPYTYAVNAADPKIRGALDSSRRYLRVRLVRRPALPVDDTDFLIGDVAGRARAWPAFERWVCMVAGLDLLPKDNDPNMPLLRREGELRAKVLGTVRLPSALPWPRERHTLATTWGALRWLWMARTATLELHNVLGGR